MHVHILGIAGTFMAGVARLAKEQGHTVTGQDQAIYPPMSTQLDNLGIELYEGYDDTFLQKHTPDCVIVGNALSRGVPVVEALLNRHLPYQSGPQWLKQNILQGRWVIGVAGTHGKTTTSSMVAWMIEAAGFNPGFLIGGVPSNFECSARLGSNPYFVIEADEYDTAFFDKRSKFLHYSPQTCILNNLEYDHADIFDNIEAIYKQFHHLIRTIPSKGLIIRPKNDLHLDNVFAMKSWTPVENTDWYKPESIGDWQAKKITEHGSDFEVYYKNQKVGEVSWELIGDHNIFNALAALAAVQHAGIHLKIAIEALSSFKSVKRRMEVRGNIRGVTVYDDFAHHPTAIKTTLEGLDKKIRSPNKINITHKNSSILVALDLRSNTMKKGTHQDSLGAALKLADNIVIFKTNDIQWDLNPIVQELGTQKAVILNTVSEIAQYLAQRAQKNDHIVIMSNGGFDGLHEKVLKELSVTECAM